MFSLVRLNFGENEKKKLVECILAAEQAVTLSGISVTFPERPRPFKSICGQKLLFHPSCILPFYPFRAKSVL